MVEYTKVNVKLTNLHLSKLKKAVKNNDGATLRIGIKNFNKEDLPHELLLTTRQRTKLRNAIHNNMTTDLKLTKTQIKRMIQPGGFLGKLLSKLAGPLMKVAMPLAKNVLAPLGLTAAMSAIDGSIQKKGFLSMLLGTLGASLLRNLLSGGKRIVRAGEGIVRAGAGAKKKQKFNLMPFHPLTNFEISEYYKNEPRFNGVYSRDNLPKTIKKGAYIINLYEYTDIGTHWIALYVKDNYIKKIFRLKAYDSIMCGYFCIKFINYMYDGKSLIDFTNLFSPLDFKKNDKTIKQLFKHE